MIEITLADLAATRALARALAGMLARGDVVALSGALGAGKTALARFVILARAEAAGAPPPAEVPSPTYTLVQIYEAGTVPLWHFDLYRLERPGDALELAIEEAFADAITLIEWPDRLGGYMPDDRIEVELSRTGPGDARSATITGIGPRGREIEAALARLFAKGAA
jgi:tRNA threonylcarbamoyladenosine biosynthesis protein TsaE